MAGKTIKTLKVCYPMLQFLMMINREAPQGFQGTGEQKENKAGDMGTKAVSDNLENREKYS